jgi:hypothetical protein
MKARVNTGSPGLAATTAEQNDDHSGREWIVLQELTSAGQAASASSLRQPGSFDQLTASKRAVGVESAGALRVVSQPASTASSAQKDIRLISDIIEVWHHFPEMGSDPIYSWMPAWSMMKAYCSAYSR